MWKIILKVCLGLIFLIIVYLLVTNWLIYYRLNQTNLKASDNRHNYVFNNQATTSPGLIYIALGDSLTAGVGVSDYEQSYPYLLAQKMAGTSTKVTLLNYSYSGARSSDLISELLTKAIADKPDVITLLIGTNDVHGNISPAQFKRNYETILTELKTQTKAKINVINIPFIGADSLLWPPHDYYYRTKTIRFNQIIKELAATYNFNYIDLATPTEQYASSTGPYYSTDNFHPSDLGYQYWSQVIYANLNR